MMNKSQPRTYPLRMPDGWEPPVPAWMSTFEATQQEVAMAVIGFQHPAAMDMTIKLEELHTAIETADIRDLVTSDAGGGLSESACIAYWYKKTAAARTLTSEIFRDFRHRHAAAKDYGFFIESVNIQLERTETLFSGTEHKHGYSQLRSGVTEPIAWHMYWGSMRDRLPHSAHDKLTANSPLEIVESSDNRVVVKAHENLCIIRSGQDWSHCESEQLTEYLESIEPTLEAGMNFLRDQGSDVNCYTCRYWKDIELDGTDSKRSSGMAYFKTMQDLENWAEHHPTHLKIFGTFMQIAPKHGPDLQLRLWHEVSVLPKEGCQAEYINCRAGTGWMSAS